MMRKSLRQIQRKEPKCANCSLNCVQDEKQRTFLDPLPSLFPPSSYTSLQGQSEVYYNPHQNTGRGQPIIKKELEEETTHVSNGGVRISEERKDKSVRKTPTVLDALLKVFSKEWKLESDLLDSTVKAKEKLILCSECSWCLSQLYEWHSKFIQLSLASYHHSSYLYPILSLCHNKTTHRLHSPANRKKGNWETREGNESLAHFHEDERLEERRGQSGQGARNEKKVIDELDSTQQSQMDLNLEGDSSSSSPGEIFRMENFGLELKEEKDEGSVVDQISSDVTTTCTSTRLYKRRQAQSHPKRVSPPSDSSQLDLIGNSLEGGDADETKPGEKGKKRRRNENDGGTAGGRVKKGKKVGVNPRRVAILRYICPEKECSFEGHLKEEYLDHMGSLHGKVDVQLIPMDESSDDSVCLICNSVFATKAELSSHSSLKHIPSVRIRNHGCSECGKMFLTKHDLRNHESTHVVSYPFPCTKCSFRTRRAQELERHVKLIHLQEKNFFCGICQKGYTLKWQLNDHSRIHREERTFSCTEPGCGKAFRTPSNLRQHFQLHRGSKYVCDICGQSYSRKAYLRLHMNGTHHHLPLPPSQKRERGNRKREGIKTSPKGPRLKSTKQKPREVTPKRLIIKEVGDPPPVGEIQVVGDDYKYPDPNSPKIVMERRDDDDDDDDDGTIHVRLDLEEEGQEVIQMVPTDEEIGRERMMGMDPNTFQFSNGTQLIYYRMGDLISTEDGNTFYVTTSTNPSTQAHQLRDPPHHSGHEEGDEEGAEGTSITIFNPFTQFIPIQHN